MVEISNLDLLNLLSTNDVTLYNFLVKQRILASSLKVSLQQNNNRTFEIGISGNIHSSLAMLLSFSFDLSFKFCSGQIEALTQSVRIS